MATKQAKNTVFSVYSASSYHQVLKVTDIKWSGVAWDLEDTTNHDNSTPVKTTAPTLYSNGTFQLTVTYDPSDTYHVLLRTLSTTGAANNFQVTHVNTVETKTFEGYVTNFVFDTPVGGLLKANITVTVNGPFA